MGKQNKGEQKAAVAPTSKTAPKTEIAKSEKKAKQEPAKKTDSKAGDHAKAEKGAADQKRAEAERKEKVAAEAKAAKAAQAKRKRESSSESDGANAGDAKESSSSSASSDDDKNNDDDDDADEKNDDEEEDEAPKKPAKAATTPSGKAATPGKGGHAASAMGGEKRLFLGNCSYDIDDDKLKEALGKFGTIESIHWVTDKNTGKFYGTGFVEFSTAAEANAALSADGIEIAGRATRIQIAKPRAEGAGGGGAGAGGGGARGAFDKKGKKVQELSAKPAGCKTMFVGGLPYSVTEDELRGLFADCGEITAVRWVERDGEFKGCGFIEFADEGAVDQAAKKNGVMMGARSIRVDYASSSKK